MIANARWYDVSNGAGYIAAQLPSRTLISNYSSYSPKSFLICSRPRTPARS